MTLRQSHALRASGHDLCRRLPLKLVSITAFVDTSNPTTLTKASSLRQVEKPRQAAVTGGFLVINDRLSELAMIVDRILCCESSGGSATITGDGAS